jgi:SAM-dependent methyltransferase
MPAWPSRLVRILRHPGRLLRTGQPAGGATPRKPPRPQRSDFDNRSFWNERYRTDPELGSGIGSRGDLAARKRDLVEDTWKNSGRGSVLDVGFGDLQVLDLSVFNDYVGVDVSDVAVEAARERYPQHRFVNADFTGPEEPSLPVDGADLVLCFDVLIHQFDPDGYRRMVQRLVRHTRQVGLVSGYDDPPVRGGPIIAFHEPLSATLAAAGATGIESVMSYRGVQVFRFGPATA